MKILNSASIFLTFSCIAAALFITSCSKDEETLPTLPPPADVNNDGPPVIEFAVMGNYTFFDSVLFKNISYRASDFEWSINQNFVSTAKDIRYKFPLAGTHVVTLKGILESGEAETISKNIKILPGTNYIADTFIFMNNQVTWNNTTTVIPDTIIFPVILINDTTLQYLGNLGYFFDDAQNANGTVTFGPSADATQWQHSLTYFANGDSVLVEVTADSLGSPAKFRYFGFR